MQHKINKLLGIISFIFLVKTYLTFTAHTQVLYEGWSAYHHILVIDQNGMRILSFDGSMESRMSLVNPLSGHFEYIEYFHLIWIWNPQIRYVLTIGLGGGSIQKLFLHHYPEVKIDTVELDPKVVEVAKKYFYVSEDQRHKIYTEDGRQFLRRTRNIYDAIIIDAYTSSRYGPSIPYHLVTKEFFQICHTRLSEDGVLAYNVIGNVAGKDSKLVGAISRTLLTVFPRIYLFPARESYNVVIIATKDSTLLNRQDIANRALELVKCGKIKLPMFMQRAANYWPIVSSLISSSPILGDEYAPIDGIIPLIGTR